LSEAERESVEKNLRHTLAQDAREEKMARAKLFYLGQNLSLKGKLRQLEYFRSARHPETPVTVIHQSPSQSASLEAPVLL